jgi:hypothetical protein|tara:strand:+ start:600 stop:1187 length:588 start_codon:yes stop_codon:yes gene_type:complete
VPLVLKAQQVQLALKVHRVKLDPKALPAQLVQQAQTVVTVLPQLLLLARFRLGRRVQAQQLQIAAQVVRLFLTLRFPVEPQELLALKVQQVLREPLAQLELLALKGLRELQARKALPELMGLMVRMELPDLKDQQVRPALREQLALKAFKGHKVIQARKALRALLEQQAVLVGQHLNICSTPPLPMQTLERESWH